MLETVMNNNCDFTSAAHHSASQQSAAYVSRDAYNSTK